MEADSELTGTVIGHAIEVHRTLGPGLLESAYEKCLCHEFTRAGLPFVRQKRVPVLYKGVAIDCDLVIDILVRESVILEIKSVQHLLPVHDAQLLTYLRVSGVKLGLLMNFNVEVLKQGIRRRVL